MTASSPMTPEQFFDLYDEFVYVADIENHELLYINKVCLEVAGLPESACLGQKCYKILQGLDEPCPFCNNHLLSEDSIYCWEYTNTKYQRHFSIKDKLIFWNGRKARIEKAVDVTQYKEEVRSSEMRLYSMLQSIPGGVCEVNDSDEFNILWYNEHFLDLIGYTAEQFENELGSTGTYAHPEDLLLVPAMMERVRNSGKAEVMEMRVVRRDGTILTLFTSLSYKTGKDNKPGSFYSVGIDITEYKKEIERSTQALKEALESAQEASLAKGRFLSRMSHEIRTPLNAVIGMAAIAGMALDNKEKLQEYHQRIDSSAKYLLSLINDILDFSRIESGKLELLSQAFSLTAFLKDVDSLFSLQAQEKSIDFTVEAHSLPNVHFLGDPFHLKQVVVNLLSNALKFSPEGGKVCLEVRQLSQKDNVAWLEFSVQDDGIGVPESAQKKIFEHFEQQDGNTAVRFGGSGLGLSISKHIVELMGGHIGVESQSGKGSRFWAQIPINIHDGLDEEQNTICLIPENFDFTGYKVLVAEDQALNQIIIATLLKSKGFEVEVAEDGEKTLQVFQDRPEAYFDIILMDIRMPIMNGLETTKAIRALCRKDAQLPIVALSANAFEEDRQNSMQSGMNGHISKPIDIKELCHVLHDLLPKKTACKLQKINASGN